MARTYTPRLTSLEYSPWDTREYLTSNLTREQRYQARALCGDGGFVRPWGAEELFSRFLQSGRVSYDPQSISEGQRAVAEWSARTGRREPTWDDLLRDCLVRIVWGRWQIPFNLRYLGSDDSLPHIEVLNHLRLSSRERVRFEILDGVAILKDHRGRHPSTPTIEQLAENDRLHCHDGTTVVLNQHHPLLRSNGPQIAARLWDCAVGPTEPAERLAWWRDRVLVMGVDSYDFGEFLSPRSREVFLGAAWSVLVNEADLDGWVQERDQLAATFAAQQDGNVEAFRLRVELPRSEDPVDQLRWVKDVGQSNVNHDEREELGALIGTLLRWGASFRAREPWQEWPRTFGAAAATRPYFFYELNLHANFRPEIAADFLMVPETASLALAVLSDQIEWTPPGAWDAEARQQRNAFLEQANWADIAECGAWAMFKLPEPERASQTAAILEHFASLAAVKPVMPGQQHEIATARYYTLRDVFTRWPSPRGGEERCFDAIGGAVVTDLVERLDGHHDELDGGGFELVCWLAGKGADERSAWKGHAVASAIGVYTQALGGDAAWYWDGRIDPDLWIRIAQWAHEHNARAWEGLLQGTDFTALRNSVSTTDESVAYRQRATLVRKVRTHVFLLLNLIEKWAVYRRGTSAPLNLQERAIVLISEWVSTETSDVSSIVEATVDIPQFFQPHGPSLLVTLGRTLKAFAPHGRQRLVGHVLEQLREVRQIAVLVGVLESDEQNAARERLRSLPVHEGTENVSTVTEVQHAVDALLDVGEVDRAEVWLLAWAERIRKRRMPGWVPWEVGVRQRVRLARERFDEAAKALVPDWAGGDPDAVNANDFLRGVALLRTVPPHAGESADIFDRLLKASPENSAYAVNFLAAKTQLLMSDGELLQEEVERLQNLLDEGEQIMGRFSPQQRIMVEKTYQVNRLHVLHRLAEWDLLLSAFHRLPPEVKADPKLAALASSALESQGQPELAAAMRADFGSTAIGANGPATVEREDQVQVVHSALLTLRQLDMIDQVRAWWGLQADIGERMSKDIAEACRSLADMAPALAIPKNWSQPEEDRITKLLVELLRHRLERLGWAVAFQEHGGYTAKDPSTGRGGIGEIDLRISKGTSQVVVGEAILVDSFQKQAMGEHLGRLMGYAASGNPGSVYLIWSYAAKPKQLWERYLSDVAEVGLPQDYRFVRWDDKEMQPTSDVWFARSLHMHPVSGTCSIAHIMVDLRQAARRTVSAEARRSTRS